MGQTPALWTRTLHPAGSYQASSCCINSGDGSGVLLGSPDNVGPAFVPALTVVDAGEAAGTTSAAAGKHHRDSSRLMARVTEAPLAATSTGAIEEVVPSSHAAADGSGGTCAAGEPVSACSNSNQTIRPLSRNRSKDWSDQAGQREGADRCVHVKRLFLTGS